MAAFSACLPLEMLGDFHQVSCCSGHVTEPMVQELGGGDFPNPAVGGNLKTADTVS